MILAKFFNNTVNYLQLLFLSITKTWIYNYRMIETDLMIEFGQIMDETEQWAGLFESFW